MKVLDEHILEYIWDETLDRIAQETYSDLYRWKCWHV